MRNVRRVRFLFVLVFMRSVPLVKGDISSRISAQSFLRRRLVSIGAESNDALRCGIWAHPLTVNE